MVAQMHKPTRLETANFMPGVSNAVAEEGGELVSDGSRIDKYTGRQK